jgi:hypothetical protein
VAEYTPRQRQILSNFRQAPKKFKLTRDSIKSAETCRTLYNALTRSEFLVTLDLDITAVKHAYLMLK